MIGDLNSNIWGRQGGWHLHILQNSGEWDKYFTNIRNNYLTNIIISGNAKIMQRVLIQCHFIILDPKLIKKPANLYQVKFLFTQTKLTKKHWTMLLLAWASPNKKNGKSNYSALII